MADTEREAFEAMIVPAWSRETYVDGDGDVQYVEDWMQGAWMGWSMARAALASRPAEVDDEDLPLPESKFCAWLQHGRVWNAFPHGVGDKARWDRGGYWSAKGFDREPLFTAEQYRQGQRDAVAADRARREKGGA